MDLQFKISPSFMAAVSRSTSNGTGNVSKKVSRAPLSTDVTTQIFKYLNAREVHACTFVSKLFSSAANAYILWRELYKTEFFAPKGLLSDAEARSDVCSLVSLSKRAERRTQRLLQQEFIDIVSSQNFKKDVANSLTCSPSLEWIIVNEAFQVIQLKNRVAALDLSRCDGLHPPGSMLEKYHLFNTLLVTDRYAGLPRTHILKVFDIEKRMDVRTKTIAADSVTAWDVYSTCLFYATFFNNAAQIHCWNVETDAHCSLSLVHRSPILFLKSKENRTITFGSQGFLATMTFLKENSDYQPELLPRPLLNEHSPKINPTQNAKIDFRAPIISFCREPFGFEIWNYETGTLMYSNTCVMPCYARLGSLLFLENSGMLDVIDIPSNKLLQKYNMHGKSYQDSQKTLVLDTATNTLCYYESYRRDIYGAEGLAYNTYICTITF